MRHPRPKMDGNDRSGFAKSGTCFLRFGAPACDSALAAAHPRHARVNGKCQIP